MKKIVTLLLVLWVFIRAGGQNITQAEYFIDTDPGFGSATAVSVTPGANLVNANFNANITSTTLGFHRLFFRTKSANGKWSLTNSTLFYKTIAGGGASIAANITAAEYFIDTDPGFGAGKPITVTAGVDVPSGSFNADIAAANVGFHRIYLRTKNANGVWSLTNSSLFYKTGTAGSATLPNLVAAEYFIDTDPGFGLAKPVTVTPGTDVANAAFDADISTTSLGFHRLFLRTKNADGRWSLTNTVLFYKTNTTSGTAAPNLVAAEYFIDTDPGFGSAVPVAISPSLNLQDYVITVNIGGLTNGVHKCYVRTKDANGKWSHTNEHDFEVNNATPQSIQVSGTGVNGPVCTGGPINVSYAATGSYTTGNKFNVELSDASGVFGATPTIIGTVTTTVKTGIIGSVLPISLPSGIGYKVRVSSTNPVITGQANNTAITVNAKPAAQSISGDFNVNGAATLPYTVGANSGSSWQWTVTGGTQATGGSTNAVTIQWPQPAGASATGAISAIETNQFGCVGDASTAIVNIYKLRVGTTVTNTAPCKGSVVNVDYSTDGAFNPGNIYTAQLSNASGSFASPVVIGSVNSYNIGVNQVGTIAATIPVGTADGTGYRIRVVSNSPAFTGTDNGVNIAINKAAANTGTINGPATGSANTSYPFSVTATSGSTYAWSFTNGTQNTGGTTASVTATFNAAGTQSVYVQETTANGCVGTQVSKTIEISNAEIFAISNTPSALTLCAASSLTVNYTSSGTFNAGNVFTAQLSNAAGSFASPIFIGSVSASPAGTNVAGAISATIPSGTASGTGYRIRVVSSNPSFTGDANSGNISITADVAPAVNISSNVGSTICSGTQVTFTAVPTNGGSSPTYQWFKNGNTSIGSGVSLNYTNIANGDLITVVMTGNAPCANQPTATSNGIAFTVNATVTPSVVIATNTGTTICSGTSVTFTAQPTLGGNAPTYQWYKNGQPFATGESFSSTAIANGDVITVQITSNATCASPATATSAPVTFIVAATATWYRDNDADGYGDAAVSQSTCSQPSGYVSNNTDCDDTKAAINPTTVWYKDADNDGYSDGSTLTQCAQPTGYKLATALTATSGDCNDANAAINPAATEICGNGVDENCNGLTDENCETFTWFQDLDGDGYGNPAVSTTTPTNVAPTGYVSNNSDCDDANAAINPATVWYKDADNDGYSDGSTLTQCTAPASYKLASALTATSGDCNDANAAINPGAAEVCNGIDDNCNGSIDEGVTTTFYRDADGDGYGNPAVTTQACSAPTGFVSNSTDCDDANAAINPTTVWYKDADNDGYSNGSTLTQCAQPTGYKLATALTATSGDCNDANAAINPAATEICGNGVDENCNGLTDENCETFTWFQDLDADGYGNPAVSTTTPSNVAPTGYVSNNTDCDDTNAAINPATVWYKDADNDGYSDGSTLTQCTATASYKLASALTATSGDCNDANAAINPGATEICGNGVDENCNGLTDENCQTFTWFQDLDGDGYGNPAVSTTTPTNVPPTGYVSNNTDCDDANAAINPTTIWYKDADGDGYSDGSTLTQCAKPTGYQIDTALTATSGDCNDANAAINPAATEICGNNVDENCNGQIDENCQSDFTWYQDLDGDGYGNPAVSTTTPTNVAPTGYVSNSTDCDDANAAINPTTVWYKDADNDGYSDGSTLTQCTPPASYKLASSLLATSGDCNDANAAVNPAATEICGNNVDENCNGQIDENCQSDFTWYQDLDGDGYGNPAVSTTTPTNVAPTGYVSNSTDCDDTNAAINPTTVWYKDADNDGYSDGSTLTQCTPPASYKLASTLLATSGDCNDANAAINPAATEVCGNGLDDNCNGQTDEDCSTDPCGGVIGVLYVNAAATTSGTGSGWSCAIQQLRDAVAIANGNPAITQIWVAKGVYKPTAGTDRTASINITRAGLRIIGGFAGTETSAAQANPITNITSISGDIGVANNFGDNSLHLLRIYNLPASASGLYLEGLLLEKGYANQGNPASSEGSYGAAAIVYNINPATDVVFSKCVFSTNTSVTAGGALGLYNHNTKVDSSAFINNTSGLGGAIASLNSSPSFTTTSFIGNRATVGNGGAIYALQGSLAFNSSVFDRNTSAQLGGAVYQEQASVTYRQTVFSGNTAKSGGAVYQLQGSSAITNSTLYGNTASVDGGAIALATASSTTARNSIFWKNAKAGQATVAGADIAALAGSGSITAQYNLLQPNSSVPADNGGTIANNLRGTNPLFANEAAPGGSDGYLIYETDGLQLSATSPALNAGSNSFAAGIATDIQGKTRIACSTVDLGAYEYPTCTSLITKADIKLPKDGTVTLVKANVTNPFSNRLLIWYIGADKADVDIMSISGQKMWKGTATHKGQTVVNTASWAGGMYQVTIYSAETKPIIFKVIKLK